MASKSNTKEFDPTPSVILLTTASVISITLLQKRERCSTVLHYNIIRRCGS
jgi:hypothetical protein